jgi:hypothetical protein
MPPVSVLKHHALAGVLGPLAYAGANLVWFFVGCTTKLYVSCSYDLTGLPLIFLIMGSAGLITHLVTATAALALGGVHRMRVFPTVGLYAAAGVLLMGLWFTITGPDPVVDYVQFAVTLFPFFASGAALGLVVWLVLRRGSNRTPHPDTREASHLVDASSARAGGRGR